MYSFIDIIKYMHIPLIVGLLLSISAAVIGVVLVLKQYSMIGDGLSHVGFGCVAIALAVGMQPLFIAIPLVVVAAYVLLRLGESKKIKGDAAIALISSSALAIGYLVGNLADGFSSDINTYMFGSIATASIVDLYYIVPITLSILIIFLLLYNRIFSVTFDESFAKASGMNTKSYSIFLAISTAIVVVIGIKVMGTLLISSLIIFPALTSMKLFHNFKKVVISSIVISCLSFVIAFFCFTRYSSAASIVLVNLAFYIVASIYAMIARRSSKN
ncbi:MAG: metal ABC transporter permease [Bacilli bacterium]|nr:metal ABC transporter permease [Bacilli bacterium]